MEKKIHITEVGMRAFCGRVVARRVAQSEVTALASSPGSEDMCYRCARSFISFQQRTKAKAEARAERGHA